MREQCQRMFAWCVDVNFKCIQASGATARYRYAQFALNIMRAHWDWRGDAALLRTGTCACERKQNSQTPAKIHVL